MCRACPNCPWTPTSGRGTRSAPQLVSARADLRRDPNGHLELCIFASALLPVCSTRYLRMARCAATLRAAFAWLGSPDRAPFPSAGLEWPSFACWKELVAAGAASGSAASAAGRLLAAAGAARASRHGGPLLQQFARLLPVEEPSMGGASHLVAAGAWPAVACRAVECALCARSCGSSSAPGMWYRECGGVACVRCGGPPSCKGTRAGVGTRVGVHTHDKFPKLTPDVRLSSNRQWHTTTTFMRQLADRHHTTSRA